ncbi:MAG: hypothetical protein R2911_21720 [Caldilineaceae bacterium]
MSIWLTAPWPPARVNGIWVQGGDLHLDGQTVLANNVGAALSNQSSTPLWRKTYGGAASSPIGASENGVSGNIQVSNIVK